MTSPLNVVAQEQTVTSGVQNPEGLAEALTDVLADSYRLMFKTHAYHWNVEGPLFFSLHKLTEEQYENLFAAADTLAERIRALGQLAPSTMSTVLSASIIKDLDEQPSAGEMCADLAADHARVAHRFHALVELAGKHSDAVTEDLATERSAFHEQAVWMLKAISAK
jgi:starvation-inducible DNA-binding protein